MMTSISMVSMNESILSRDTQLDHYAKAIENIKDQGPQEAKDEKLAVSYSPFAVKYQDSENSLMKLSPFRAV